MTKKLPKYAVSFLISLVITWSAGLFFVTQKHFIESPIQIWLYGLLNTLFTTGFSTLLLSPFYYFFKERKIVLFSTHLLFSIILLIELISIFYFSITLSLLDNTILQFKIDQLLLIFKSYFQFKWYYLLFPFPIIFYFILLKFIKIKKGKVFISALLGTGFISLFFQVQWEKKGINHSPLSINKSVYLINSLLFPQSIKYTQLEAEDISFYQQEIDTRVSRYQYPLYHKTDTSNPLADFFTLNEQPPNLVFIIVESLSASYSGHQADEISYTPFLDSLAQKSLYFDNFLATAERSFAALPSILGSLPHGERGFTHQILGFAKNKTLSTWLFENGYTGDFHYGGYARFDNMDLFMKNQKFKNIYQREEYNYEGTELQTSVDSIPFGIPDGLLLKNIVQNSKRNNPDLPFFDVYFTLSSHYPFMIENPKAYYEKTHEIITKANVSAEIKAKHNKYVPELASFLYVDDALKFYFTEKAKQPEHQNTIYVIVGDHAIGEIVHANSIGRYRPVLMIYSPLLKTQKNIVAVNSQLDIAPSFYSLLQQKYHFAPLDSVSWLGEPFDTSSVFRSKRSVLFMLNDRRIEDFLHQSYFLSKENLYQIGNRFTLTPVEDKEKKEKIEKLRTIATAMHRETVKRNRLIPDDSDFTVLAQKKEDCH